ncbi:MAG: TRAP transporter substrate-binding protein [Neomegalonema sp.]|nr:TRAP transporter substrate-binding protein [Neomegalonema sp.]
MTLSRRHLIGAAALVPASLLAAPAIAQGQRHWTMVTSWPKGLPGPGVSADRLAARITALSGGALRVTVSPAGARVPPFGVFDAVALGTAQMGHTASVFWAGKTKVAPFFTAVPFGLTPVEHLSWIEMGGGQAAWDALYAPFGVKPFLGGNTGASMGGWFKDPVQTLADLSGRKMRIAGLGAEVMRSFGIAPVSVAPGEIASGLLSGLIDAAEFASPAADAGLGLDRAAKHYLYPGFHEPNGASEALVNRAEWEALPSALQAVVAAACREEHALGLAEAERASAEALSRLVAERGVILQPWPKEALAHGEAAWQDLLGELRARSDGAEASVIESWQAALVRASLWSKISAAPFLATRV